MAYQNYFQWTKNFLLEVSENDFGKLKEWNFDKNASEGFLSEQTKRRNFREFIFSTYSDNISFWFAVKMYTFGIIVWKQLFPKKTFNIWIKSDSYIGFYSLTLVLLSQKKVEGSHQTIFLELAKKCHIFSYDWVSSWFISTDQSRSMCQSLHFICLNSLFVIDVQSIFSKL